MGVVEEDAWTGAWAEGRSVEAAGSATQGMEFDRVFMVMLPSLCKNCGPFEFLEEWDYGLSRILGLHLCDALNWTNRITLM